VKSLLLEEKVAEAAQSGAKTDEVETCTNPVRDLKRIFKFRQGYQSCLVL